MHQSARAVAASAVVFVFAMTAALAVGGCAMAPVSVEKSTAPQQGPVQATPEDGLARSPHELVAAHRSRIETLHGRLFEQGHRDGVTTDADAVPTVDTDPGAGASASDDGQLGHRASSATTDAVGGELAGREAPELQGTSPRTSGLVERHEPNAAPLDACEEGCLLAQEICTSSATICEVAAGHRSEASFAESCSWAEGMCSEALESCTSCRPSIVRGE